MIVLGSVSKFMWISWLLYSVNCIVHILDGNLIIISLCLLKFMKLKSNNY